MLYRSDTEALANIKAHTHGTLMQIRLAVRGVCGTAHHRHHRHTAKNNHTNIRHTFVAIFREQRIEVDQRLDHGRVVAPAEAVQAGQDVRRVPAQVAVIDHTAAGLYKVVAIARGNHQNTLATAALHRLDDECVTALEHLQHPVDLELVLDHPVQLRHHHVALQRGFLGEQLVVHELVITPRIIRADKRQVAPVHTENATLTQHGGLHQLDHFICAMSRKR